MIKNGKNDFDIWSSIVNKMDLTKAVAPVVRGRVLLDESEVEMYNKIQKLLNSTGMESSHRFLYSLDPSDLTESEITKVNNLYKLGVDRGFIEVENDEEADSTDDGDSKAAEATPATECDISCTPTTCAVQDITKPLALQKNAFTIIYSATRDGAIKTGEAYSNCINTCSAKADVISKLEKAGYQNITILAIEAGDPDSVGCNNTYYKLPEIVSQPVQEIPDYSEDEQTNEADDSDPISHALDPVGVKASSATLRTNNVAQMSEIVDDEKQEEDEQLDEEDDEEKKEKDENSSSEDVSKKEDASKETDAEDGDAGDSTDDKSDNDDKEDKKEEDVEEPDEKLKDDSETDVGETTDDEKELSTEEKEQLKDTYKKAFKATLQKCKFTTSFSELSLEEKVQFFTELSKAWGDKADPSKFMTDKEIDQLEKIIVKKS